MPHHPTPHTHTAPRTPREPAALPPSLLQRAGTQRLVWALAASALLWLALWATMSPTG